MQKQSAKKPTQMSSIPYFAGKGAEKGRLISTKCHQECLALTLRGESDWSHLIGMAAGVHRGELPTSRYRSGIQPRPAWPLGQAPSAVPHDETDPDMKNTSPNFKESLLVWVEAPQFPRGSKLVFENQGSRSKKLVKTPQELLVKCRQSSGPMCAMLLLCCAFASTQLLPWVSLPDSMSGLSGALFSSYVKWSSWI